MTLRSSDLQSDSDLDSIRNSCDVYSYDQMKKEKKKRSSSHNRHSLSPVLFTKQLFFYEALQLICKKWRRSCLNCLIAYFFYHTYQFNKKNCDFFIFWLSSVMELSLLVDIMNLPHLQSGAKTNFLHLSL